MEARTSQRSEAEARVRWYVPTVRKIERQWASLQGGRDRVDKGEVSDINPFVWCEQVVKLL